MQKEIRWPHVVGNMYKKSFELYEMARNNSIQIRFAKFTMHTTPHPSTLHNKFVYRHSNV